MENKISSEILRQYISDISETEMVRIYIASAYTKGDVALNVRRQLEVANELMNKGYCPIVPLFTHFQHMIFPRPYEDWMQIDFQKVSISHILFRDKGESSGADREVAYAIEHNIPVIYSIEDLPIQSKWIKTKG
jgi:hypothetical protein